jgi:hypothetical protein
MSSVPEILKIALYVLLGLWFAGILSMMVLSACALFGFVPFETATAKAKILRRNLLRIWLAMLGLVVLCLMLSIMFGQK